MPVAVVTSKKKRKRYRLLYKLEASLETPMFLLAILWLVFFIIELLEGLTTTQETLVTIIWILFIFEFLLKLFLAPRKLSYIKHNWLTIIALAIPAFRIFRSLRTSSGEHSGCKLSPGSGTKSVASREKKILTGYLALFRGKP